MDVDEAEVEIEVTPGPQEQIQQALAAQFSPFPFTPDARNTIYARRSLMSDELVFDLLLEQASIASPQSLYPPDSPESLLQLFEAIANCSWDALKKSCLHFYLFCHVSPSAAAKHARACTLPPQFVHLAHACFLLDSGSPDDLARAVALLSDSRIVQDLAPKILHTFSLAPQPGSSRLVRTYVRTAQPVLEAYEDLAIYLRALMEYSLADAWTFQRTFSEMTPIRNQLIRTILDGCLIPPKPTVLPHLLSLPLTSYEFSLLQSYALSPPDELSPAAQAILQDLITVRLLHSGKYSDAVRLSRAFDTLNAKSRVGASAPLHKAAEERQQMMRDVLAVVPEVQRRQLEMELNDDAQAQGQGHGHGQGEMGASWASVGSDVSMSWENLGASGSSRAREKTLGGTRSGRLEGSPAPVLPGRSNVPNTPFGPFSSPANATPKRNTNVNIFGTPTSAKPTPPVFPLIPTPGLATSTATAIGTPPILGGFRLTARVGFGTPLSPHVQPAQNGLGSAPRPGAGAGLGSAPRSGVGPASAPRPRAGPAPESAPRSGAGLNARNAFYDPEPSRAGRTLFGRQPQPQGEAFGNQSQQGQVATPNRWNADGGASEKTLSRERVGVERTSSRERMDVVGEETLTDEPPEDMVMIDSDDPDGFVIRGRRRQPLHLPPQNNADADPDAGASSVDGAPSQSTTLFGRDKDKETPRKMDHVRRKSPPKIPPGGFASFELTEDVPAPSTSSAKSAKDEPAPAPRKESRSTRTRSRHTNELQPQAQPQRLKIPGALFEDEDAEAEEKQDSVPSLPPAPAKAGRRKRVSHASSVAAESTDEDDRDAPRTSLRRSSRLSSTGPSPEPPSPQKKTTSKRTTRAAADGTGRTARKRKNADE